MQLAFAQDAIRLAMNDVPDITMRDFPAGIAAGSHAGAQAALPPMKLAVAPPYGPHLRGIVGREAGAVEGFIYSKAFLKALKGTQWDEAALDKWLTSPQKMVTLSEQPPGVVSSAA